MCKMTISNPLFSHGYFWNLTCALFIIVLNFSSAINVSVLTVRQMGDRRTDGKPGLQNYSIGSVWHFCQNTTSWLLSQYCLSLLYTQSTHRNYSKISFNRVDKNNIIVRPVSRPDMTIFFRRSWGIREIRSKKQMRTQR